MLRINVPANSAAAKAYYSKAGDYYGYGKGGEYAGRWQGKLAEELGLSGAATMEDFHALCDNRHPKSGERLTGCDRDDRRPLIDFTWSVPKSVALMRSLAGDERIEDAIWDTVNETMGDIEQEIATRVRKNGAFHNRIVSNGVIVPFYHRYSRPVKGEADPGDHIHACLMNVCRDPVEDQLKAVEIGHIKANAPYWQAVWHARLATKLHELGYDIRKTKDAFEIAGISRNLIDRFSRRTDVIEQKAEELGITDPDEKSKLGAKTRENKSDQLSPAVLFERLMARLKTGEAFVLNLILSESKQRAGREAIDDNAAALDWALRHLLVRKSVVEERELLTAALKHGIGGVSVEGLKEQLKRPDIVRATMDGKKRVSTQEVLNDERSVLEYARSGRGKVSPLNSGGRIGREWLSAEQKKAVRHVWNSKNRIMILRGRSGTGKTTTLQEIVDGVKNAGHSVVALAVSSRASRGVLREEAKFKDATTLAQFFDSEELQETARAGLIVVDEASMMGFREAHTLIELAKGLDARLLLSGDRRQNRAVSRGEPLALIEDYGGVPVAELKEIRRQRPQEYREAVECLASGNTAEGFDRLDAMGAIKVMPVWDKYEPLVSDYVQALHDEKSALVLCPTNKEGEKIAQVIRNRLKEEKLLAPGERQFARLIPLKLTEAEREDVLNYEPGRVVQFFRRSGAYRPGQRVIVTEENAQDLATRAKVTQMYAASSLPLAVLDTIRITTNGKTKDGKHKVENGTVYTIKAMTPKGDLVLNNGWILDKNFSHLAHGYVLTSFAGQGNTVDRVLVAIGSESYPAANARELYVDASRGRDSVTIYTDCKETLRHAATRDDRQLHALDLMKAAAKKKNGRQRLQKHSERFRLVGAIRHTAENLDRQLELSHEQHLGYGY